MCLCNAGYVKSGASCAACEAGKDPGQSTGWHPFGAMTNLCEGQYNMIQSVLFSICRFLFLACFPCSFIFCLSAGKYSDPAAALCQNCPEASFSMAASASCRCDTALVGSHRAYARLVTALSVSVRMQRCRNDVMTEIACVSGSCEGELVQTAAGKCVNSNTPVM